MTESSYSLKNITSALPNTLAQYLEAQYHIWDESLVLARRRLLEEPGTIFAEPYLEATPSYVPGRGYEQLEIPTVAATLLRALSKVATTGIPAVPYSHQAKALQAFLGNGKELVISTGTGSGKTESFLMPVVGALALERSQRVDSYALPATRAILLYPMNALVNDQMSRLRRLLGSDIAANGLRHPDGYRATFGMYTSRTPYPGPAEANRTEDVVGEWIDKFFLRYESQAQRLRDEGKWPAKDLRAFRSTFTTDTDDSELLTRHEMHKRAPDVLVTNYSMLEYMLLRPVDAPIFDATRAWLAKSDKNQLILVLDEAHLYQGAQGTEVALLLRRLLSRLRVSRDRVRFILTSASLASGKDAEAVVRSFARELTGAPAQDRFAYVEGELDRPSDGRPATHAEAAAFSAVQIDALLRADADLNATHSALSRVLSTLGLPPPGADLQLEALRDSAYEAFYRHPVSRYLAAEIMGRPRTLTGAARAVFPDSPDSRLALDGLLACVSFARRSEDRRPLLPSRLHLLFRGLAGIYACVDPQCSAAGERANSPRLGRLYAKSRDRCACGARVYEMLTHRDCGAAFLRAYFRAEDQSFLWHESSTGLAGQGQPLSEVHLLVETERDQVGDGRDVWLHKSTGRLEPLPPADSRKFLHLRVPDEMDPVPIGGRLVHTFDRKCPVCRGRWKDRTRPKIMDLTTKGEDPFSHLVSTQIRLQPPSSVPSRERPNAGRKSLLFSDGRQKAARLARDVPRVIEQDAFRQVLLLCASDIRRLGHAPRLSDSFIYVAFLHVVSRLSLHFFDGTDAERLRDHVSTFEDPHRFSGDLAGALEDGWRVESPAAFRIHLMRALGSKYYSLSALGLGYARPRQRVLNSLKGPLAGSSVTGDEISVLATVWIQGCLEDFALYGRQQVTRRSRAMAAGYEIGEAGTKSGFSGDQKRFLRALGVDVDAFEAEASRVLSEPGDPGLILLPEDNLEIVSAVDERWVRCKACTHLSPVTFRELCVACGSKEIINVPPGGDTYLRARKAFWREPVERVLSGADQPMTLDVEEHTAQLGYRDLGDLEATTESYERRFRDILLKDERAIDALSCTTTMEVGVDIGSLIAVSLRNMPPSRHNYQQRAGRAGRRGSAVSTVLTFAQNHAHDSALFENPSELIAGHPSLLGLDVENPALVRRHAFAEILQEFFESATSRQRGSNVFAVLGTTTAFFSGDGDGTLLALEGWLRTDPDGLETLQRIAGWLPAGAGLTSANCRDELLERLSALSAVAAKGLPKDEEQLIEFLFARGVLPAYAFPRDLISLQIEKPPSRGRVEIDQRPQQAASIALSEYAPGRRVVVNKKTYRIGAVTADTRSSDVNRARPLFATPTLYLQCANCLYTVDPAHGVAGSRCRTCGLANLEQITIIQPEIVWPEGKDHVSELDDEQVFTETTVAQLPIPKSNDAFDTELPFGRSATLRHGRLVPLITMNRGEISAGKPTGFQVCEDCGFTVLGGAPFPARHDRHYYLSRPQGIPRQCGGAPHAVYLGYQFLTDVLLLSTPLTEPFLHDLDSPTTWAPLRAALNSLSNAIALSASGLLDVDPRELQCGYRLLRTATGAGVADVYIYDTLAGGAGYSKLAGLAFQKVFSAVISRLESCDCDASCAGCLRTYANRMTHESLDRHLALDFARFLKQGVAPTLFTPTGAHTVLQPVRQVLELDGWRVAERSDGGLSAKKGGRSETVYAVPSLLSAGAYPAEWSDAIVFTEFEIRKDLPSCIARLPS